MTIRYKETFCEFSQIFELTIANKNGKIKEKMVVF